MISVVVLIWQLLLVYQVQHLNVRPHKIPWLWRIPVRKQCTIKHNFIFMTIHVNFKPELHKINSLCTFHKMQKLKTRGYQEPVIAHLVFNLTSKVNRKWGCYT